MKDVSSVLRPSWSRGTQPLRDGAAGAGQMCKKGANVCSRAETASVSEGRVVLERQAGALESSDQRASSSGAL